MFCPHTHANAYKPSSTVLCECNLMLLIWWAIPWMSRHTEKGVDSTMPTASTIKGLDNCFSALLRTSVIIFYADAQSFIVISWTFIPFQSPIVLAREGSFTFIHLFFFFWFLRRIFHFSYGEKCLLRKLSCPFSGGGNHNSSYTILLGIVILDTYFSVIIYHEHFCETLRFSPVLYIQYMYKKKRFGASLWYNIYFYFLLLSCKNFILKIHICKFKRQYQQQ